MSEAVDKDDLIDYYNAILLQFLYNYQTRYKTLSAGTIFAEVGEVTETLMSSDLPDICLLKLLCDNVRDKSSIAENYRLIRTKMRDEKTYRRLLKDITSKEIEEEGNVGPFWGAFVFASDDIMMQVIKTYGDASDEVYFSLFKL